MFFKKIRHSSNNDAIMLLKYALLGLLLLLTPITLFLTGFAWYGSLQFYKIGNLELLELDLYLKNGLIFGSVGLISFLFYFLIFLVIDASLKRVEYKWKKVILLLAIAVATLFFLLFEIFSAIFIEYLYSWQMSLVLTFWPLIYILILVLLLVNYFEFYNDWKMQSVNKKADGSRSEIDVFQDRTEIIS
ncbi:hypothetical protein [Spiroplasma platyhelix]|uniref:Transmembrane protein n=1 Tax=Spiroplasma platyhelix PALS-1 TaxID=1276218 RepID=A0A846UA21_9MOLU|nr:hypothetical protein [Spiroplasma platyhelix]MBE4704341.1 hypothetical protein [Spiroplasma platyhelix PALS-1]NKE38713.1 hypothetical protein [Spiroplasma platyhelix PALS-1]UJB28923.1 hypothetical protein SPLAT_v1c01580 [Spiroplasma platyhelix PALS-1]